MADNVVIGFEDTVREPVFAHEVPEVFDRVEFGRFRRQWQDGDVFRHDEIVGHVPACLIHDEDGMRILIDMAGDFGQVLRHRVGVAPRHDESCRFAELGADCTEDIGRPRALVVRCRRPGTAPGPAAGDLVLLANTGLVLEPNLYAFSLGRSGGNLCHCGWETFLKSSIA